MTTATHSGSFRRGLDPRRFRRPSAPAGDRFWPRVQRSLGCWEWTGRRSRRGYGEFDVNGGRVQAHRMAWALAHGPIPHGLLVCHSCDNPACVRPDHLFLGTQSDNMRDMAAKGRHAYPSGEAHPQARVSDEQADEIRALYECGDLSQAALGTRFGICQTQVSRIVRGVRRPRRTAVPLVAVSAQVPDLTVMNRSA